MQETQRVQNVGAVERWVRVLGGGLAVLVGLVILLPSPASVPSVVLGVALVLLGADFVFTGITGYCPLYNRLGWSTARTANGRANYRSDHQRRNRPLG